MQYNWVVLNHATDSIVKLHNNVECMTRAYCCVFCFCLCVFVIIWYYCWYCNWPFRRRKYKLSGRCMAAILCILAYVCVSCCATDLIGPRPPHYWGFLITHTHTYTHTAPPFYTHTHTHTHTHRTALNEWSARRRGRYLHNIQQTQQTNIHALSGIQFQEPRGFRPTPWWSVACVCYTTQFQSPTSNVPDVIIILRPLYYYYYYSMFGIKKQEFGAVCIDSRLIRFPASLPHTFDLYRYFVDLISPHLP